MKHLTRALIWIDHNALFLLTLFLLVFIPLFPKIPLFDILPGYIVRVRPEDFLIAITGLVWLKEVFQGRIKLHSTYLWFIGAYALVGLISLVLAVSLIETVPPQLLHIGKSALHFFRYLEYFSIFFFAHAAITTKKRATIALATTAIVIMVVVFFGIGQQYAGFPVYSTMNREYSKGQTLYLQDGARPQSTFGGHYDLAAYLVIVLPLIWAGFLYATWQKKIWIAIGLFIVLTMGEYMLLASGSKTAFFAYVAAALTTFLFFIYEQKLVKATLKWGSLAAVVLLGCITMLFFSQSTERQAALSQRVLNHPQVQTALSLISRGTQTKNTQPKDLDTDGHEFSLIATTSAEGITTYNKVPNQSTWSENALKYGISMGIRLDTLWPQAIRGFFNNPLFGNGYATLSKVQDQQFTEADSTDNNFLRTLGETGLLGFLLFYGLVCIIFWELARHTMSETAPLSARALRLGFIGAIVGIAINAIYIDVFAASKVAFTFWAYAGATLATVGTSQTRSLQKIGKHLKEHWPLYSVITLAIVFLHQNPLKENSLLRDFAVETERVEQVTKALCALADHGFNLCTTQGGIVRTDSFSVYSWLLLQIFKLYQHAEIFFYLNILLLLAMLTFSYFAMYQAARKTARDQTTERLVIASILILILGLSVHAEIVSKPLFDQELFFVLIGAPLISAAFFWLCTETAVFKRTKSVAGFVALSLVIAGILIQPNTLKEQFKSTQQPLAYQTAQRANLFFEKKNGVNPEKTYYLISNLSPFFFDFYRYTQFSPLPLSNLQPYGSPENFSVWNSLIIDEHSTEPLPLFATTYNQAITQGEVFLTDYGIAHSEQLTAEFARIKQHYDLHYEVLDCQELCNMYSVQPAQQKISQIPESINNQVFQLETLQKPYEFAVISHRFAPTTETKRSDTRTFTEQLTKITPSELDFLFLTGDITHKPEQNWLALFLTLFGNTQKYPMLFANGNVDLQPQKSVQRSYYSFFTETEYFLILDLPADGSIDTDQKLFVYNSLLELEKLPEIKTLFVIAHELKFEKKEGVENFSTILEEKLHQFPELATHVFSHKSEETNQQRTATQSKQSKIQYHAISTADFLRSDHAMVRINELGTASVEIINTP